MLKLTPQDKEWSKAIKERDGYKCVICGSTLKLNSHHLIARENHICKFDINNGITLCTKHHFFCRKISAHNNPIGFFIWLELNRPEQYQYCIWKMQEIINDRA